MGQCTPTTLWPLPVLETVLNTWVRFFSKARVQLIHTLLGNSARDLHLGSGRVYAIWYARGKHVGFDYRATVFPRRMEIDCKVLACPLSLDLTGVCALQPVLCVCMQRVDFRRLVNLASNIVVAFERSRQSDVSDGRNASEKIRGHPRPGVKMKQNLVAETRDSYHFLASGVRLDLMKKTCWGRSVHEEDP